MEASTTRKITTKNATMQTGRKENETKEIERHEKKKGRRDGT